MSNKDEEIKELKERLEKLEESNPKEQKEDETKPGCMSGILILLLIMIGYGYFFSDNSETSPDDAKGQSGDPISLKLTCKLNPNAMYEDRITFNGDMTTATLESTNKNTPVTKYKVKKSGDNLILNGTQTRIDIDKNKELIPDVDLFILTEGKSDYWNRDLYYFSDFETDPVRYLTCHETYNKNKKEIRKLIGVALQETN